MEQIKKPQKKIKFELRHSPLALKVILTLLIIFSMAALTALRWVHLEIQAQTDALKAEAAKVEYANSKLTERINNVGTVQSIEDIAREELGLVDPNTVVIQPNTNP